MKSLTHEDLVKTIKERHSVRSYNAERKIDLASIERLEAAIEDINRENPTLSFRLVTNEPKAFNGMASYGQFKGVENYFVIAGEKGKETDVQCGREGEKLVLLSQYMGLNTCWVGLTYKKVPGAFEIDNRHKIRCLISLGYGLNQMDRKHKIKTPEQVSNVTAESPKWFKEGVDLALLAPTAINQQKFYFELKEKDVVIAKPGFSLAGYTRIDLGIAIEHFLIGADRSIYLDVRC